MEYKINSLLSTFIIVFSLFGALAFPQLSMAEDDADIDKEVQSSSTDKMTIREAKGQCKSEGKKGKDLILCIKEKLKK